VLHDGFHPLPALAVPQMSLALEGGVVADWLSLRQ